MTAIPEKVTRLRELIQTGDTTHGSILRSSADMIAEYYRLVLKWNERLHLTTITEPEHFLERHILEVCASIRLIDPQVSAIWDLGSGLGVPGIPLKIFRPDLQIVLVESGRRKVHFLETVIAELALAQATVDHRRIEDLPPCTEGVLLTGRAIERMESLFPTILQLGAKAAQILLFSTTGPAGSLPGVTIHPLPGAHDRCIAELKCSTWNN